MNITEKDIGRKVFARDGEVGVITGYNKTAMFPVIVYFDRDGLYGTYTPKGRFLLDVDCDLLEDLIGFTDEYDKGYEPFNLEKALAGEPVILRDGNKAYVRHHETELNAGEWGQLIGYVEIDKPTVAILSWRVDGLNARTLNSIVGMYPQYKKVNGEKIPLFHDWRPVGGEYCYLANPLDEEFGWTMFRWSTDSAEHKYWMDKGLVYPATEEGESAASLHSRAMLITGEE